MNSDNAQEDNKEIELVSDESQSPDLAEKFKKTKEELKKCGAERKEYLDSWQRSRADHINYKNDEAKRMEDMARFVITGLIKDLFPVLDSFDLALSSSRDLSPETEKGILLIRAQFEDVLKKRGVEQIKVEPGEIFDPGWHESIGEVESDKPEGTIAEIVQRGYMFRGRVLRPARVRIAKAKE